jgi:hypothetical protein
MNKQEAQSYIKQIKELTSDPESAHSVEDDMLCEFVKHVAAGDYGELSEVAQIVASSADIKFARWYA